MSNESPKAVIIDARGHKCPVPTLRLQKALRRLPHGETVELWASDPMALIDVPYFCQTERHVCQKLESAAAIIFQVTKHGSAAASDGSG